MTRLNLILYAVLMVLALGTVTAQHRARQLFGDLEVEKEVAQRYETEWRQLQTEQSTWAVDSRVEAIASGQLHMHTPEAKSVQVVMLTPQDALEKSRAMHAFSMQVQDLAQANAHKNAMPSQAMKDKQPTTPSIQDRRAAYQTQGAYQTQDAHQIQDARP